MKSVAKTVQKTLNETKNVNADVDKREKQAIKKIKKMFDLDVEDENEALKADVDELYYAVVDNYMNIIWNEDNSGLKYAKHNNISVLAMGKYWCIIPAFYDTHDYDNLDFNVLR